MNPVKRWWIWLSRIAHCRGFGIQSPGDYSFVRYVVNEHYPYYAYRELGVGDDWLSRKLGRLHMRIANWRQPALVVDGQPSPWWQAGCRKARLVEQGDRADLWHIDMATEDAPQRLSDAIDRADEQSVVVVDHIYRHWELWHQAADNSRVTTAFDLYYCGILLFNRRQARHYYKINF